MKLWRAVFGDQLARERVLISGITTPVPISDDDGLDRKSDETDLALKRWLSVKTVRWMGAQLFVANVVFIIYGFANRWDIPAGAISVWLSATVVQVVGVVYIIARYLFPPGGSKASVSDHEQASTADT